MITITVKTLTGTDFPFEVEENLTIRQFKDRISERVNVPAERQRLIFQGRVLQDERILSELGLDHRTVHLVERLPGVPGGSSGASSPLLHRRLGADNGNARGGGNRGPPGELLQQQMVMGALALPSDDLSRDQIAGCLRRILNRIGEVGRRAELEARETADGSSIQVEIRLRSLTPHGTPTDSASNGRRIIDSPATQRVEHIRHVIRHINHILYHLEHDDDDRTGQPASTETPNVSPSSVSGDQCENCDHQEQTADASQGSGRENRPSDNTDHLQETDNIDGDAVEIRQTRIAVLPSLLDEIMNLETRLRPHLARYQAVLREDVDYSGNETEGRRVSRLFNGVQTILHNLAHVYHTYSDLNVHFCQLPPRSLYPQLVGIRGAPPGNRPQGSQRGMWSTVHTTAEVQITMNFQRGSHDGPDEQSQPSPQPQPQAQPPSGMGIPTPFPNIRVEGADSQGGAFTTVDISPNTVTINQVTARIEPNTNNGQQQNASGLQQQHQQPQQMQVPANFLQQIIQGLAGATGGVLSGNFGVGPGGGLTGRMHGFIGPQQRAQAPHGIGMRMPMPRPRATPPAARPPLPQQGQFVFGGPVGQPHARMIQPQNLIFTAAPFNLASNAPQPAVFVGYDPPAMMPLYTFDEYLPCASRHFDPRQRPSLFARRPPTESASASASTSASQASSAASEETAGISQRELDFERNLEPIIRSVVMNLQENIHGVGGQQDLWQFIPVFTSVSPSAADFNRMRMAAPPSGQHLQPDVNPIRRPSSDPNLARPTTPQSQQPTASSTSATTENYSEVTPSTDPTVDDTSGRLETTMETTDSDDEAEYTAASSTQPPKSDTTKKSEDEQWNDHLPPEWVRVVETDVERQKAMPSQKPFSDAYLSGMPSKRRKLVLEQRPRAVLNAATSSTDSFLKEVLRQSITEAGVTPITGEQTDDVIDHVSVDENGPELEEAFARNVQQRFGARLRSEQDMKDDKNDKDFDPERFPNANSRFCKK